MTTGDIVSYTRCRGLIKMLKCELEYIFF